MNRRTQKLAVALLALSLSLTAPSAFAAGRSRDTTGPAFMDRVAKIVMTIKKAIKAAVAEDEVFPKPPIG